MSLIQENASQSILDLRLVPRLGSIFKTSPSLQLQDKVNGQKRTILHCKVGKLGLISPLTAFCNHTEVRRTKFDPSH